MRIPHLSSAEGPHGEITDLVIWELMKARQANEWLRRPLPDQQWFEDHLPGLLTLRRQLRDRSFPADSHRVRLETALTGRHLSIRFAYQNPELIADVISSVQAHPDPDTNPARYM